MSFPNAPTDGQIYTNNLGTSYIYSASRGAWLLDNGGVTLTPQYAYLTVPFQLFDPSPFTGTIPCTCEKISGFTFDSNTLTCTKAGDYLLFAGPLKSGSLLYSQAVYKNGAELIMLGFGTDEFPTEIIVSLNIGDTLNFHILDANYTDKMVLTIHGLT